MRLLSGCVVLLAVGVAIVLLMGGVVAIIATSSPGDIDAVVAAVDAVFLLLGGFLPLSLRNPYRRVHEAPGGWAAIIGGMLLLLAGTFVGGSAIGGVPQYSLGWVAGLAVFVAVQGAFLLLVVLGIRAVALGVESLRLPPELARRVIKEPMDPGSIAGRMIDAVGPEDIVDRTAAAGRRGLRWMLVPAPGPRPVRIVLAAAAQSLVGLVLIFVALLAGEQLGDEFRGDTLGVRWFLAGWGALAILSAIGLYSQIGLARVASGVLAVPTTVIPMLGVLGAQGSEGPGFFLVLGLMFVSGVLVLIAVGWLRAPTE